MPFRPSVIRSVGRTLPVALTTFDNDNLTLKSDRRFDCSSLLVWERPSIRVAIETNYTRWELNKLTLLDRSAEQSERDLFLTPHAARPMARVLSVRCHANVQRVRSYRAIHARMIGTLVAASYSLRTRSFGSRSNCVNKGRGGGGGAL